MRPAAVGMTALATLALAACTGGDADPDASLGGGDATAAAQGFLDALAEGDFAGAAAWTVDGAETFATCPWMASDTRTGGSVVGPAVEDVTEDGDRATAEVTYRSGGEVSTTLDLTWTGDTWAVVLPETFAIEAAFSEPAVARLELVDAGTEAGECGAAVRDGVAVLPAFPGSYNATIIDPTGVVDYGNDAQQIIHVTGAGDEAWDLGDPLGGERLATVQADLTASGTAGTLTRVWTDDGAQWSAEVDQDGTAMMGTLSRDDSGTLEFTAGG
ncbi:hypothetical protein [Demequina litorisediminis]|uniref:Uncharacterized protein n=1 Tax=Demequina litorisediminis TaxID=1849022 RepID=A0ABQ6IBZ5_9MICO|nr:hypothetical protein [Demequina litorisediminis]GMA35305.1 hypothetical protein GCM10025876_15090 [Demequina litorisediminis]